MGARAELIQEFWILELNVLRKDSYGNVKLIPLQVYSVEIQ